MCTSGTTAFLALLMAPPMAVASMVAPANGMATVRTPARVTDDRLWITEDRPLQASQTAQPRPIDPAPTPMEATAIPRAHCGTIRLSGWATGGVSPTGGPSLWLGTSGSGLR